ncbi:WD40 repeat-like protein [Pisolithus croceorrhizus]|nr:WD40 repeat-like protein [Pisolithus croceorrhizus]KAI6130759.1 WD40 repeat-like protein [Pisolithus croceorrhizus]KAI6161244.1 WD40 repeat-like protein [Pisolithus thermaeus]
MDIPALLHWYCAWAAASGYGNDLNGQIRRTPGRRPLRGSTAFVHHGTFIPNGLEVAIKTFPNTLPGSDAELKRVFQEVHLWSKLRHENIVPMFGISTDFDFTISIISEWMPMGNAHAYVQHRDNDPRPLLRDIASGLSYLHSHELGPVVHGDLKGLNVLVSSDRRAILTDFGLATINVSSFNMTVSAIRGGSYQWMAPELLDDCAASKESDVWAFGMTALELFTRRVPFPNCRHPANVLGSLIQGRLPPQPTAESTQFRLTDAWWEICMSCWERNPSLRPTVRVIVEMVGRAMHNTGPAPFTASAHGYPPTVDTVSRPSFARDGPRSAPITDDDNLPPCATLSGPADKILSISFSPDGSRIASGSANRLICQWDVHSRALVGSFVTGHLDLVRSVAFSPNGKWIASGSYDGTVCMWGAHSDEQIVPTLQGHTGKIFSVVISPDGTRVASGSADKTVRLWDVETRRHVRALTGHTDQVQSVAVSCDYTIVSGSHDNTVRLWDLRSGVPLRRPFKGHTDIVWSVAFSPDGRKVVSSSRDRCICVWDLRNGSQVDHRLEGHSDEVTSVAFSPCGRRLVSGSMDSNVFVWDADSGARVGASLRGNAGWVRCVAFSPDDGRQIVSGTEDGCICVWNERIH